ncbi:hypothetical protein SAMN05660733_00925 [Lentzea albidocapillata]|uniref:SH3 domain-containing protein n=1 Tax=Lentzea albidocapillata TaxID=40571 RepID=A0A1W2B1P9_9PSEU|nr:hypothetical protein SAMN05660733_00925 [Lentzea albidocapillata]
MTKRIIAVTVAALAGMTLTAMPASAAVQRDYQVQGASIRASAHGDSTRVGLGYIGQGLTAYCGKFGPTGKGSTAVLYWIHHRNNRTGVTGWTAGGNVGGIIHNIPSC